MGLAQCRNRYSIITDNMVCAGGEEGKNSCQVTFELIIGTYYHLIDLLGEHMHGHWTGSKMYQEVRGILKANFFA